MLNIVFIVLLISVLVYFKFSMSDICHQFCHLFLWKDSISTNTYNWKNEILDGEALLV